MRKTLLLLILYISSYFLYAQKTLKGTIKDAKTGQALAGGSVKLKSGKAGVVTDNSGVFKIQVSPGDELEISMVSYNPRSVVIADQSDLLINLEPGSSELTEIVFVGSRGAGRAKTETPVPVDVIKVNQAGLPTAGMDLTWPLGFCTDGI